MKSGRQGFERRAWAVPMIVGSVLASAGCNNGQTPPAGVAGAPTRSETVTAPPAPAQIDFSVEEGARSVKPDQPLTVTATDGELHSVRLTDADGDVIPGRVEGGTWTIDPKQRLVPKSTYTWTAAAVNESGEVSRQKVSFTTITPKVTATYRVTPDGQTVGVGMPVMVTFDSSVTTAKMRAEVERRMTVSVTPAQKGSWGWLDDRQLMWRPDTYWKPGTKIKVKAPLSGVQTGPEKWIAEDKSAEFTIAKRARVSVVDLSKHTMTVRENGKTIATYPISGGRPTDDWETRSGTKIITEKHEDYVMDAGTLGLDEDDPDYYRTEVKYAMRVTNTGEFLHSAPWSVWAQGRQNVSHGCVNLGPAAAARVFGQSIIGDVVEFKGSGRRMKPGDGVSVWLFDAKGWHARSALAQDTRSK